MAENKRYRTFNLLLYPDNTDHKNAINRLLSGEFRSVGIVHNMDCYDEDAETHKAGELKKEHMHFIVKFQNNRTISALAKDLNIEERFIEKTVSFKNSAKYLLHIGTDKYQYDVDDLMGNLKADVLKLVDDTTEDFKAIAICDIIDNYVGFLSMSDLIRICGTKGLYSCFRRGTNAFRDVLKEHNIKYQNQKYSCDFEVIWQ